MALLATVAVDSVVRGASDADELGDQAKSIARAIPIPGETVNRCPADQGRLVTRRWRMSEISRAHQARVTGFAPYTEWLFEKIEFDGFRSIECRLQEAKARYDQFFDPKTGYPKAFFEARGVSRMLTQARKQSAVVRNSPPAKLTWYFMQPISHAFFSRQFASETLPIESLLHA
ncbi:restriction endonuclease fold toxin 5 domain-containing protein [Trinickia sp. EG282A]|uniref:restriction endonuclease fold toxin 5 domain-containing protein n=1 Tax=Trinickia sp. EG282A TaxID=3237013 RepID=UPI0034D27F61